jgi:hypothetical protein
MGVGYKVNEDGTVNENYWEKVNDVEENSVEGENTRKPYKLELVGVVCDGYLAVIRGIRYIYPLDSKLYGCFHWITDVFGLYYKSDTLII